MGGGIASVITADIRDIVNVARTSVINSAGIFYILSKGFMKIMTVNSNFVETGTGWTQVGSIPDEYKPTIPTGYSFQGYLSSGYEWRIMANGTIDVYSPARGASALGQIVYF